MVFQALKVKVYWGFQKEIFTWFFNYRLKRGIKWENCMGRLERLKRIFMKAHIIFQKYAEVITQSQEIPR